MSSARVVYAEIDGSDEAVRLVISRMMERVETRRAAEVVVDQAPRMLPGPGDAPPAKRRAVGKLKHAPPAEEGSRAEMLNAAGKLRDKIRELLTKRAMTSGEMIKVAGATPSAVYQQLSRLRPERVVEMREDAADGQRKNYLVK